MRQTFIPLFLLALLCLAPAKAAEPKATESALVGRYEASNGGPIATAVALRKNGRFGFNLLFVEHDVFVAGTWQVERGQVVLRADADEPVQARVTTAPAKPPADAQVEQASPPAGSWAVHIDGAGLPRLRVAFQAASGESKSAPMDSDGNADVAMAPSETWVAIKLRAADSEGPWFTLAVPPAAARQRQAVVQIDNPQSLVPAYFTTLTLNIVGASLVVARDSPLAGMVYERGEPEQDPPRQ